MSDIFVIGIDFGTDSVRSIIVNTKQGKELAEGVSYYPRWKEGKYSDAANNQFRQHPLDYIESLEESVKIVIENAKKAVPDIVRKIKALAIDTTGSTPCIVDKDGIPLALNANFMENPNAMFILWKDHTAIQEATEINKLAHSGQFEDYTKYVGGIYSAEWFLAKLLHVLRVDEEVRNAAYSCVEHCDWVLGLLAGNSNPYSMKRYRCPAGHKLMWNEEFGGLPSEEFLTALDPLLSGYRPRLFDDTVTSEVPAGTISHEWAERLGLSFDVVIGGGAFDAHFGAVGAGIESFDMVKIIGTSTCDIVLTPHDVIEERLIKGICGQVDGSVIPNYMGLEAGQSAFGDLYAGFNNFLKLPMDAMVDSSQVLDDSTKKRLKEEIAQNLFAKLNEKLEEFSPSQEVVALDWVNGRRTPNANQYLKSSIMGLSMGTDVYRVYAALVEATAFGARSIQECFVSQGIPINRVIVIGGVAKKNDAVIQILSDVLNRTILVSASEQACALGAAMFAAVSAGVYSSVEEAQSNMNAGFEKEFHPRSEYVEKYNMLYQKYLSLGVFIENQTERQY